MEQSEQRQRSVYQGKGRARCEAWSSWVWEELGEEEEDPLVSSPTSKPNSDFGPWSRGGFLAGSMPTVQEICFHLLILLLSCKVLNVIILPFLKQEKS